MLDVVRPVRQSDVVDDLTLGFDDGMQLWGDGGETIAATRARRRANRLELLERDHQVLQARPSGLEDEGQRVRGRGGAALG